ncbi:MAG: ribosome biogenesis factor YjgA [Thiobacillaceae bacterium]
MDPTQPPSKTRLKKEMHALQALGTALVGLSPQQLERMDLPETLHEAVLEAQRIRGHEARRRQLQYIGRLMRNIDAEPIAAQLAHVQGESAAAKAEFHAVERWRARLLEDDTALGEWLATHPGCDAQMLRQLIRNARREAAEGKPPRASRALFRLLRDAQQA